MIFTDVTDTIHADSLALFALNIEILLADVTKPEKSKIMTLTWPVTSSVTSGSNFWPCTGSSRTLSNGVWNLEISPVVWEISGGALCPPPPSRTCYNPYLSGARVNCWWYCWTAKFIKTRQLLMFKTLFVLPDYKWARMAFGKKRRLIDTFFQTSYVIIFPIVRIRNKRLKTVWPFNCIQICLTGFCTYPQQLRFQVNFASISGMLRSSYTMRTKCAISDAFVRDRVFAYCASVDQYLRVFPISWTLFQSTQKRNIGRKRPRLRTL